MVIAHQTLCAILQKDYQLQPLKKKKNSSEVDFIIFLSVTAGETETFGEVTHLLSKSAFQTYTYFRHLLPSLRKPKYCKSTSSPHPHPTPTSQVSPAFPIK